MRSFDVVIIGAGAAGLMCAIEAGKRKRKVMVLDHNDKVGRKILISGGGRCNFTNTNCNPDAFVSQNVHFCKSALARYTANDFISLVKKYGIKFHEKKLGQLFCDNSAQEIVSLLVDECHKMGAQIQLGCKIESVDKVEDEDENSHFLLRTNKENYQCKSLVVATGGLSIPQIGASGFGYDIARQFGLSIVETAPALDGFNFKKADRVNFEPLAGVSIDTVVSSGNAAFRENILFTHTGLSGPASLQASLYWKKPMPIIIDLLPELDSLAILTKMRKDKPKSLIKNALADVLPKRFADEFCSSHKWHGNLSEISEKRMEELASMLKGWQIFPDGTVGYRKAEVTRGGVNTNELSSQSMEAKRAPGLYFVGEVVDVTGQLGGYNFQWAWSSGFAAGQYV